MTHHRYVIFPLSTSSSIVARSPCHPHCHRLLHHGEMLLTRHTSAEELNLYIPFQNVARDAERTLVKKEIDVALSEGLDSKHIQSLHLPKINPEFTHHIQSYTTSLPLLHLSPFHPTSPSYPIFLLGLVRLVPVIPLTLR